MSLLSSAHWSCVGSTPVGLCAQACSKNTDSSSAACTSESRPTKQFHRQIPGEKRDTNNISNGHVSSQITDRRSDQSHQSRVRHNTLQMSPPLMIGGIVLQLMYRAWHVWLDRPTYVHRNTLGLPTRLPKYLPDISSTRHPDSQRTVVQRWYGTSSQAVWIRDFSVFSPSKSRPTVSGLK